MEKNPLLFPEDCEKLKSQKITLPYEITLLKLTSRYSLFMNLYILC